MNWRLRSEREVHLGLEGCVFANLLSGLLSFSMLPRQSHDQRQDHSRFIPPTNAVNSLPKGPEGLLWTGGDLNPRPPECKSGLRAFRYSTTEPPSSHALREDATGPAVHRSTSAVIMSHKLRLCGQESFTPTATACSGRSRSCLSSSMLMLLSRRNLFELEK